MHDPDSKKPAPGKQPDHLLDELTSIKALLDSEQRAAAAPIPVLDDVVGFSAIETDPQSNLLDLAHIFGDDAVPASLDTTPDRLAFPKFTLDVALSDAPAAPAQNSLIPGGAATARQRREALIQELVAEFLPRIEATLRARLDGLDDESLQAFRQPD